MQPLCAYFDPAPPELGGDPDGVTQTPHDASPDLTFFVPLPDGGAVRVRVCERHAEVLTALFGEAP